MATDAPLAPEIGLRGVLARPEPRPLAPRAVDNLPQSPPPMFPDMGINESPFEPKPASPNQYNTPLHQTVDRIAEAAYGAPLMSDEPSITPETGIASQAQQEPVVEVTGTASSPTEPIVTDETNPAEQPKQTQRKIPFGRILTGVMAAGTLISGSPATDAAPLPMPAPIVETMSNWPSGNPPVEIATQPPAGKPMVDVAPILPIGEKSAPVDKSLACPATKEYLVQPGGSLARGLIETNGLGRYLNPDGTFNEDLIYNDLLCTVYLPENQQQLEVSDPEMYKAVKSLKEHQGMIGGPVTADMLREVVVKVNEPRRYRLADGTLSNPQLALTYSKDEMHREPDKWQLPDFSSHQQSANTSVIL